VLNLPQRPSVAPCNRDSPSARGGWPTSSPCGVGPAWCNRTHGPHPSRSDQPCAGGPEPNPDVEAVPALTRVWPANQAGSFRVAPEWLPPGLRPRPYAQDRVQRSRPTMSHLRSGLWDIVTFIGVSPAALGASSRRPAFGGHAGPRWGRIWPHLASVARIRRQPATAGPAGRRQPVPAHMRIFGVWVANRLF
jgi:hypothetical protein